MVTLSDGRTVTYDLGRLTLREYRSLFEPSQPDADADAILSKVTGLDDIGSLPYLDWRRLMQGFFKAAREPLADPN